MIVHNCSTQYSRDNSFGNLRHFALDITRSSDVVCYDVACHIFSFCTEYVILATFLRVCTKCEIFQ